MRRYSVLQALPLSFFSRPLYRDVARSWRGAGLVYLLLLAALPTALIVVRMELELTRWIRTDAGPIADQLPPIRILHGVVRVDGQLPITIRDSKGEAFAIIDTTVSEAEFLGSGATLMLTSNRLYLHRPQRETRIFDLSTVTRFSLDREKAHGWLRVLQTWSAPIALPCLLVALYVFRIVQALIGAGFAMLVARALHFSPVFGACMRLAAVALTPAILAEAALDAARARPPYWGLIWSVLALAFIVMAIRWSHDDPGAPEAGPEPVVQP